MDEGHSLHFFSSLKPLLHRQDLCLTAMSIRGLPAFLRSDLMSAKVVWQFPNGASLQRFKGFRTGQRALLALTTTPKAVNHSGVTSSRTLYLNLIWCGCRAVPEEICIPISFEHACYESADAWSVPTKLESNLWEQRNAPGFVSDQQRPQDVLCTILAMLQGDLTGSFLKSETRRYLSEPETPSFASREYPLVLKIPLSVLSAERWWHFGPSRLRNAGSAISCCPLVYGGGKSFKGADMEKPLAPNAKQQEECSLPEPKSMGSKASVTVGPWKVKSQSLRSQSPLRAVQLHKVTTQPLEMFVEESDPHCAAKSSVRSSAAAAPSECASLWLLFTSEDQREAFMLCVQKALSACQTEG